MAVDPIPTNRQDGTTIRAAHVNELAEGVNDLQTQIDELPPGGYSAYELWLQDGNEGTVEDFLESLRSDLPGPPGDEGPPGVSPEVTAIDALPAADGITGAERVPLSQDSTTVGVSLADVVEALALPVDGGDVQAGENVTVRLDDPVMMLAGGLVPLSGVGVRNDITDETVVAIGVSALGAFLAFAPNLHLRGDPSNNSLTFTAPGGTTFGSQSSVRTSGWYETGNRPSAPAAPSAGAAIFSRVEEGKTELCVRFPTGAVQVIATEP